MENWQPYRWITRQAIGALAPGVAYELRFDQVGDVFPPGMVGQDAHPQSWRDMRAFAEDVNCTLCKDDALKAFVFHKRQ